jgi:FHS family L-fucose permease-like MFS transporter
MTQDLPKANSGKNYFLPMLIISALFFMFGFVTWLNGILIPYLKIACELTNFQALFVAFAFYIAYTVMALPSAYVLKKTGFKNGMILGLLIIALGTLIFIPAAYSRTYWVFLMGLFVMGTGLAILQTASNPYVTIIGPRESAARRISILGICNKLAGAIAPIILAYYILSDGDTLIKSLQGMDESARLLELDALAMRVVKPYIVMTIVLILMGIGIRLSPLPEIEQEQDSDVDVSLQKSKKSILQFPHLILGAITLFFYVGAEVIAGDTIIRYGISLDIKIEMAKRFTSYTMVSMVVGYVLGILLIPRIISQRKFLLISSILGILCTMGAVFTSGFTSIIFVALFGLSNAIVWPAVWPLALHNLGDFINKGSALLIMAIAGGAILPLLWGKLSDIYSSQQAYWMMIPCYLVIMFYAVRGYKLNSWSRKA